MHHTLLEFVSSKEYRHNISINSLIAIAIGNKLLEKAVGVGQPNCNGSSLRELFIPLPPITEQVRITSAANSLLDISDNISTEKDQLVHHVSMMKSQILSLAIRGKLVPQNPNDEPASVLLERIRAEKEELIKQGKIKRNKKESIIFRGRDNSYYEKVNGEERCINEEIPFSIPDSWIFVRLKHISNIIGGGTPKTKYS